VIELAIISALGFAFLENIVYFMHNWDQLSAGNFFMFAVMRVTIVTMVHMLCSGILGYYYGMAFFASPMLKIQYMKKNRHPVLQFLKKILHLKRSQLYHDQMFILGLLISMVTHAMYDFFLTINARLLGIPMVIPIMFIYFFGGFWFLDLLLKKKDHNLKLHLVGTSVMPKEDFIKLLDEIHAIKDKMESESNV
jgi:RsiW-degrading membrane proteinase PrsW (M82 family)